MTNVIVTCITIRKEKLCNIFIFVFTQHCSLSQQSINVEKRLTDVCQITSSVVRSLQTCIH